MNKKCEACGTCCEWYFFNVQQTSITYLQELSGFKMFHTDNGNVLAVPRNCKHYNYETKKCNIHDTKEDVCSDWYCWEYCYGKQLNELKEMKKMKIKLKISNIKITNLPSGPGYSPDTIEELMLLKKNKVSGMYIIISLELAQDMCERILKLEGLKK